MGQRYRDNPEVKEDERKWGHVSDHSVGLVCSKDLTVLCAPPECPFVGVFGEINHTNPKRKGDNIAHVQSTLKIAEEIARNADSEIARNADSDGTLWLRAECKMSHRAYTRGIEPIPLDQYLPDDAFPLAPVPSISDEKEGEEYRREFIVQLKLSAGKRQNPNCPYPRLRATRANVAFFDLNHSHFGFLHHCDFHP